MERTVFNRLKQAPEESEQSVDRVQIDRNAELRRGRRVEADEDIVKNRQKKGLIHCRRKKRRKKESCVWKLLSGVEFRG